MRKSKGEKGQKKSMTSKRWEGKARERGKEGVFNHI